MNFMFNGKISAVPPATIESVIEGIDKLANFFKKNGKFPVITKTDTKYSFQVLDNLNEDTKPFYQINLYPSKGTIAIIVDFIGQAFIEELGLIGCFPVGDFGQLLLKADIKEKTFTKVTEDYFLLVDCTTNEFSKVNRFICGTDQFLTQMWMSDKQNCANQLAYAVRAYSLKGFDDLVTRREIKNAPIADYLPSLETNYPGMEVALKDWVEFNYHRSLKTEKEMLQGYLLDICHVVSQPVLLEVFGQDWVDKEIERCVNIVEVNGFKFTRDYIPNKQISIKFDLLLNERSKQYETNKVLTEHTEK